MVLTPSFLRRLKILLTSAGPLVLFSYLRPPTSSDWPFDPRDMVTTLLLNIICYHEYNNKCTQNSILK